MKPRRPSTSRSVLRAFLKKLELTHGDRVTLNERLTSMGRASGDTERFFIDELPTTFLDGFPGLVPLLIEAIDRNRARGNIPPYAEALRRYATDS